MRLVACMLARNEDWVLALSARVALSWCDALVVGLHCCVDRSRAILDAISTATEMQMEINCIMFDDPKWDEMAHRQAMLQRARDIGATHIAIVDADEIITSNIAPSAVRAMVKDTPAGQMLCLPGYNLRDGLQWYHANGIWGERWFSFAFKDQPILHWSGDTFHQREPLGFAWRYNRPMGQGIGGIMHLWGASERRLRAKHALYKMSERVRWPSKSVASIDATYSAAIYPSADQRFAQKWEYKLVPREWWNHYEEWMGHLDVDRVPWQELECRLLALEHGAGKFKGLDLFGVV